MSRKDTPSRDILARKTQKDAYLLPTTPQSWLDSRVPIQENLPSPFGRIRHAQCMPNVHLDCDVAFWVKPPWRGHLDGASVPAWSCCICLVSMVHFHKLVCASVFSQIHATVSVLRSSCNGTLDDTQNSIEQR